jgi:arsenite methyltransferase
MMRINAKPNYGIDAPGLVRFFLAGGVAVGLTSLILGLAFATLPLWAGILNALLTMVAVYLIGMGILMITWSKVIKVRARDAVLDKVNWRGDEQVLDIGCGRGLMVVGAARRLTSGHATGIDIWLARDQSGNVSSAALENARIEGVEQKIIIQTADMRSLPFADSSFDVVMSHWVVHNLAEAADRDAALFEMARVLRPGGILILCDIEHRNTYLERLSGLGLTNCSAQFWPILDAILGVISFGSFRPTTILAHKQG